jgi:hypothetical protein
MTDIRAEDEDRLPWLEAVDDEDEGDGPSPFKLIVAVLIGLAAIGGIVGAFFWISQRNAPQTADAELVKAPEGDYKVRPDDPGGMTVEGEGDTAFQASAGADPKGQINTGGVTETPVSKNAPPQPQPKVEPKATAPAPAAPTPAAGGATIQLGAFSSQAGATSAWKAMSGRFGYLAPLSHSIVPVSSGGKTLYRLRANGPAAADVCGRLRVAGESCVKID